MKLSNGHSSLPDDEYVRLIRRGGAAAEPAIRGLYLKYQQPVRLMLRKRLARCTAVFAEPDDLLHDAFLVLLRKIELGQVDVLSLCAYWKGIAKMLLLNELKKYERLNFTCDAEELYGQDERTPESLLLQQEEDHELELCFSSLGTRCQQILILWASQYSMEEIAARMNLSGTAMARKIKYECMLKLKEEIRQGHIHLDFAQQQKRKHQENNQNS